MEGAPRSQKMGRARERLCVKVRKKNLLAARSGMVRELCEDWVRAEGGVALAINSGPQKIPAVGGGKKARPAGKLVIEEDGLPRSPCTEAEAQGVESMMMAGLVAAAWCHMRPSARRPGTTGPPRRTALASWACDFRHPCGRGWRKIVRREIRHASRPTRSAQSAEDGGSDGDSLSRQWRWRK